jgi:hypothetical protein
MYGNPRANAIPEARIVRGKHSPNWSARPCPSDIPSTRGPLTYERATPMAESVWALVCGLWPLLAITAMGIALLWTGTIYGTP